MTPENKSMAQGTQEADEREQFVRQVEDRSLPADEVLSEQRESPNTGGASTLFVP